MADNIPFELQTEIMKRLPVKSLLRFRTVSKSYNSLINSSNFIAHYPTQHHHLLVSCCDFDHSWIIDDDDDDDDSFPKQRVSVTLPDHVKKLNYPYTVGTSHGLFCISDMFLTVCFVWNPSIRKAVAVNMPHYKKTYLIFLGFGVCRETMDPKIVKFAIDMDGVTPWQVEVFALSTRACRSPYSTNIPSKCISLYWDSVVLDGCLYWLACDRFNNKLIVSFDLTSEEFGQVSLPDSLASFQYSLFMYKLRESLVVIEPSVGGYSRKHHVWMMDNGAPKSFKRLFTISSDSLDVSIVAVRGFSNIGEALIEVRLHRDFAPILAAYEPLSKSISNVGIDGKHFSYIVSSYMETLLLL